MLATVKLYRRAPIADCILTLRYTLRSRNAWIVILPVVSVIVFGLVLPFRNVSYPSIILLPVTLLHLNAFVLYGMPPSVLLLGSSRWESVRLFNFIERGIYPYRVVVLLEPSQAEPSRHSSHHWMHFEVDNLRILGPHSWRDVVHRISESVPLVVLDTRLPSPAVVEETKLRLQQQFRDKTLFVLTEDDKAPSIEATGIRVSLTELHTARLHSVVDTLKKMGLVYTTSPDDSSILAQASYARNSKRMERGMVSIARAGMPFAAALKTVERSHGSIPFVMAARKLQKQLNGRPGDGSLEVFAQLSGDIAETEQFITEWRHVTDYELQNVVARARTVHRELCRLQQAVDQAPPVFMQRNAEILERFRKG